VAETAAQKTDNQKSDEELLATKEEDYSDLSDPEISRLEKLQADQKEKGTGPEGEGKPEKGKEEGQKPAEEGAKLSEWDELIKKKKFNPEKAKELLAKSYTELEKHNKQVEMERAEIKKKLEKEEERTALIEAIKEKLPVKSELTPEQQKEQMRQAGEYWSEQLANPETAPMAVQAIIASATKTAKDELVKEYITPLTQEKERREREEMAQAVGKEISAEIEKLPGENREEKEAFYETLKPTIAAKFETMPELKEAEYGLRVVMREIKEENPGLFATKSAGEEGEEDKKPKSPIDTGVGIRTGKQKTITSKEIAGMTDEQIAQISDKDLDAAIRQEQAGRE